MLLRCVMKWWELRDCLANFSQRWQGIRQRTRTRALLWTFMLWSNGKCVFFRVENFFNFAQWMNKIRLPASYSRKLLCLFCREMFCTKTVSYCFCSFGEFAKVFEKQVWGERVDHLHSAARTLSSPSRCFQIVSKSWMCWETKQFSPTFTKRLLTSCVFLSHTKTLHCCENKIDKEDSIAVYIRVD